MTERVKTTFETMTVSFRFILPIMFAMFIYNYTQDQNRLHSEVADIKDNGKMIMATLAEDHRKTSCINQNLMKCCSSSSVCS